MWLLHLLPLSWFHLIVSALITVGACAILIGALAKHIPLVDQYNVAVRLLGTFVFCFGIYLQGVYTTDKEWKEKEADMQRQVQIAEAKAQEANEALAKSIKEKVKVVKDVQVVIQERIKEVEKKIDAECKVAPEAIKILNDSAANVKGTK